MNRLTRNMSIRAKMVVLITLLLIISTTIAAFGFAKMNLIRMELQSVIEEDMPLTEITTSITTKQLEGSLLVEKAFNTAGIHTTDLSIKAIHQKLNVLSSDIEIQLKKAEHILEAAKSNTHSADITLEIDHLASALTMLQNEYTRYHELTEEIVTLIEDGSLSKAQLLAKNLESQQIDFNAHIEDFLLDVEFLTTRALKQTQVHEQDAIQGMALIGVFGLAVGIALGVSFTRALTLPLCRAVRASNKMADGDLTVQIKGSDTNDETGALVKAMNHMASKLKITLQEVLASANEIASVAEELAASSEQTNQAISVQQLNTQHVVAAVTELSCTIQSASGTTIDAVESTQVAEQEAVHGKDVVDLNNSEIQTLVEQINKSIVEVRSVSSETQDIGRCVNNINEIAEQTNLLALNAAIEAARSGEQGRGFAVVADEVRALALRTQTATSEIDQLISNLQLKADNAASSVDITGKLILDSAANAETASDSLAKIQSVVTTLNSINTQVAARCEQQAVAAEEINQSIIDISHSGTEVLSSSTYTSKSSENLASMALQLRTMVNQFQL